MSLINEALKKAQRQRTEETVDAASPATAATPRITKRGKATSANTLVLVGSGAVVLVVLSVVATVFWVNRPSTPPAAPAPKVVATAPAPEPAPAVVVAPLVPPATPTAAPAAASVPATETPPPAAPVAEVATATAPPTPVASAATSPATSPAVAAASPAPQASVPVAAAPAPEPLPPQPNERIAAFVEAIRVTGIRSSGTDSKVLMNERVYRVNDLVDRSLNLRLTKVAPEGLTFTDANGVTYVKNF